MGRSQVLYNRTKGRYKSRGGRGGRGSDSNHSGRGGRGHKKQHHERIAEEDNDNEFEQELDYDQEQRRKQQQMDESMVLLADDSMSGHRNAYYDRAQKEKEDKEAAAFGILEAGGSINVPSMAATFQSMKFYERLNMPEHVVALAFRKAEEFDSGEDRKNATNNPPVDDDEQSFTSVTIAGTRNRATILSDGQVEVRHKPGDASIAVSPPKAQSPEKSTEDNADIHPASSTASTSKHIIMQMISEDGPDQDKYLVLNATDEDLANGDDDGGHYDVNESNNAKNVSTNHASKAGIVSTSRTKTPDPPEESNDLEAWLDDAVLEKKDDEKKTAQPKSSKEEVIHPPSGIGRPYTKKSKIPTKALAPATTNSGKSNTVAPPAMKAAEAKSNTKAPNSPFNRHQYQKQRRRHFQKLTEAEESSASLSTEDVDEDEAALLKKASGVSYDVYSVDSGGKMFDNSESDTSVRKKETSAAKKNAMRDYVVNTKHQRKEEPKKSKATEAAKTTGDEDGEDLDDWLDSVIE